MKEKKPFKTDAIYQLKKRYLDKFQWTENMFELYGEKRPFAFKVSSYCNGVAYGLDLDGGEIGIATNSERYMFKRVDNK